MNRTTPSTVRPPAVAGLFYPSEPRHLERELERCFSAARVVRGSALPRALVAPHAGYLYSGAVAASAYATLLATPGRYDRVVLLGPSHRIPFRGAALSGAEFFATPCGNVPVDRELTARVSEIPGVHTLPTAHAHEHSLEVHLPFLQMALGDFSVLPMLIGFDSATAAKAVLEVAGEAERTLIVVSTDLSHYQEYDDAQALDSRTCTAIETLNPAPIGPEQACGSEPLGALLNLAERRQWQPRTLDIRNSGDTAGDHASVVGYGAWAFG